MHKYYRRKKSVENWGFLFLLIPIILGGLFVPSLNLQPLILIIISALVVFAILGVGIVLFIRYQENRKLKAIIISQVDRITGIEFEKYVGEILKSQGYTVSFTATSGDYGIDIIASRSPERLGIQLKRYSGHVGIEAVQQAYAGLSHYNCNNAWVITNSYFTKAAKNLAEDNKVELFDREKLAEWIVTFSGEKEIKEKIADSEFAYKLTEKHAIEESNRTS
jgi:restriction system protein